MIPFWYPDKIVLVEGWLELHPFGMFVATGIFVGIWLIQRRADEIGVSPRAMYDLSIWVLILAFIMAHEVSLFFYFPERVFGTLCSGAADCPVPPADAAVEAYRCMADGRCNDGDWTQIFMIHNGISSFGGFLGAAIAIFTWFRFRKIKIIPKVFELTGGKGISKWKAADLLAYGFSAGWFFGRMGCFSAHDHVGKPSESFLAVMFPDGWRSSVPAVPEIGPPGYTPRFDLGLLEVFWALGIFLIYHLWARKQDDLRPGWYASVMMISYAPYRFGLDFLRARDIGGADTRYLTDLVSGGLTPGQIGAVVLLGVGIATWVAGGRAKERPEAPDHANGPDEGTGAETSA